MNLIDPFKEPLKDPFSYLGLRVQARPMQQVHQDDLRAAKKRSLNT